MPWPNSAVAMRTGIARSQVMPMFPSHRNITISTTISRATCTSCTTLAPRIGVQAGKCTLRSSSPLDFSCVMDSINKPGEQVEGDHAGEQEGGEAGAVRIRAQGRGLDAEDQAENGRVDQQGGQGLEQGPGPAQHRGSVAGGEIAVGERPYERPLAIQLPDHWLKCRSAAFASHASRGQAGSLLGVD